MSISKVIKALLAISNKKQADLLGPLEMGSKQSLSNKFSMERWTGEDLVAVAAFCGCKLAFVLPDGQHIFIDSNASPSEESGE